MSPARAFVLRELRLVRLPFLLALVTQLASTYLMSPRTYALLLRDDRPFVPMLFGAWLGYHRFYAEQVRGTWLVQPFSRARAIALKGAVALSALLVLAFVHAACVYAWIATASATYGPLRPIGGYLLTTTSVEAGAGIAILASGCAASFTESRVRQVACVGAGLLWAVVGGLRESEVGTILPFPSDPSTWAPLCMVGTTFLGSGLVLTQGLRFGRAPSVRGDTLSALWLLPPFVLGLGVAASLAPNDSSAHWQTATVLRDGEVVVADFGRGRDGRARRRDGRSVELWPAAAERASRVELMSGELWPVAFGQSQWPGGSRDAFLSADGRTVLLYDQHTGGLAACWGADGLQSSGPCAPFDRIASLRQLSIGRSLVGVQLVTDTLVLDLDADDTVHERFRGATIEAVALLDSGNVRAIFMRDALTLIGRVRRTCPPVAASSLVGLLDDDTLVAVHQDTITYCHPTLEVSSAPWPRVDEGSVGFSLATALLSPLSGRTPDVAPVTWGVAAALRALGWLALTLSFRRRGLLVALPGLVLGPAYFLSAALAMVDASAITAWWSRVRTHAGRGARPAHS